MNKFIINLTITLGLAAGVAGLAVGPVQAEKRYIVVTAIEPKGGATVDKEAFPAGALPDGKGYVLKQPDQTGRWEVSVYVFDPRQIFVTEGDEVTLEFVGINGASHPITIAGYNQSFELKRGQATRVTFSADKPGMFPIVCATHHPTMVAELIVAAQK
jgi:nitrous oxide reductase